MSLRGQITLSPDSKPYFASGAQCMHILFADDEPDLRSTMQMILQLAGHSIDLAANGAEAVELATRRVPDVVLMDLRMPIMD